jgi:hypothetical protein
MPEQKNNVIKLTRDELEIIVEKAVNEGVTKALEALGLNDENARKDIREAAALVRSYNLAKNFVVKSFWKSLIDWCFKLLVMCLALGVAVKCGFTIPVIK